jgi:hypothetical protein
VKAKSGGMKISVEIKKSGVGWNPGAWGGVGAFGRKEREGKWEKGEASQETAYRNGRMSIPVVLLAY